MPLYKSIIDQMAPHAEKIEKFDLWCLGEPTIDPFLVDRIKYARKAGFRNMAVATNGHAIHKNGLLYDLIDSECETIIASIDASNAETHAKIRVGLDFDQVVKNFREIVAYRDKSKSKTRFIFRFVLQDANDGQYPEFLAYWERFLDKNKRDDIYSYNEHNWGGYMGDKKKILGDNYNAFVEAKPCHYVFESMCILADGTLALCPADFLEGQFKLGNVNDMSPIEAFNSAAYQKIRKLHLMNEKNGISLCNSCTILYSNSNRGWNWKEFDDKGGLDRPEKNNYMKL